MKLNEDSYLSSYLPLYGINIFYQYVYKETKSDTEIMQIITGKSEAEIMTDSWYLERNI